MPPLKYLEEEFPIIDANFQRFCASHGIFSVEDFLVHDLYMLAAFAECEATSKALKEAKERRLERIMTSILCHSVFDIFALLDVLHQLELTLRHQVKNEDTKICLLIVDSISSLITPILGGKGSQGRSLMVSAGFVLKKLAHEHNLAVLVTNHMVGGEGGVPKPALGESWKGIPHVRLLLSRDNGSNICNVSVLKHTFVASGRKANFVIHD